MTPRSARTITFDLDDTLIRNAFSRWVIPEIAENLANGRQKTDVARSLHMRHRRALERGDAVTAYDWQVHTDALAEESGLAAGTVDVAAVVRRHAVPDKVRLLHDKTIPVLRELRDGGWRVAILTNGFRVYQEPVLRATGLWEEVDEVFTTDDLGWAKPDRRAFAAAFGGASTTVHVGDRIDHDIQGARRAAATSVLMRRDAPFVGRTAGLDADQLAVMRAYLVKSAAAQRAAVADDVAAELLPDAVVADIVDLPPILDELGEEATR
ncbi:HAD-IA family hydrolase [Phytoactinopolyspora alkaliphila]|uniref:HAD-IA family hydrolase n=1 Tax=Phytoactinopolyspora alkaliphila TaxID=1783498 RepID=A0A6N9YG83_9ACTN|nr:HAD-IA family hydrolase [Phytoactinopolyspora alkaliphila]